MSRSNLLPAESAELEAHAQRAAKARLEGVRLLRDARDGRHYATSASRPGVRYYVTLASCTCPGFVHHGHCKHHSALVIAHLLESRHTSPDSAPRGQARSCSRQASVSAPASHDRVDAIHTASGLRIGFVTVSSTTTQAWGFDPKGAAILLQDYGRTDTDTANRAADRVHRHYEASHWAAPAVSAPRPPHRGLAPFEGAASSPPHILVIVSGVRS